jgi:hypothetical protein
MGRPWGRSGSPPAGPAALRIAHLNTLLRTVYTHLARSTQKGSAGRSINQIRLPRCQACAERLRPALTVRLDGDGNKIRTTGPRVRSA